MTVDEFVRNFEEATEGVEPGTLGPDTRFQELPQWDSLAVLTTLAMIDTELEVSVSANEIVERKTLRDLFEFLSQRKS